jgi:hypothetical protein
MTNIFPYDVYRVCSYNSSDDNSKADKPDLDNFWSPRVTQPECGDSTAMTNYFNNATVREAMHVSNFTGTWTYCSHLNYTRDRVRGSIYFYPTLLATDLDIWVYSGDTDSVVPTYGTQQWINELNLTETEAWHQ